MTAITFVALGTSLPDLFASRTATINEETADAAIGNVTGSNSVNVFLGLGVPWTLSAAYAAATGGTFVARSNGIGLSLLTYVGCALVFFSILAVRRHAIGAELGGPRWLALLSSLVAV